MQSRIVLGLILIGLLVGGGQPALAGSFTLTTTSQQDAALAVLLMERNAALTAQGKSKITMDEYVQIESRYILNQTVEKARAAVKAALMQAIDSGDTATETAMRESLGALK